MNPPAPSIFAYLVAPLIAAFTFIMEMSDAVEGVFVITNILAAISWLVLGVLTYRSRRRYSERSMVFTWIRPLSIATKIFCAVSFVRCVLNDLVIVAPAFQGMQAMAFIANNVCLAIACGYASIYYSRIPEFLDRAARHQSNSRRFDVFRDNAVDGIVEIDDNSDIWYANNSASKMFGFVNRLDMLGRNLTDLMPPRFVDARLMGLEHYLATGDPGVIIGNPQPARLIGQRKDGTEFPLELTLTEYKVNDVRRFCAIIRDVSYLEKVEGALVQPV